MKLSVLAIDYDGTIAENGWVHPDVLAALAEVRQRGIVVILVTGRILRRLREVAGDLRFADVIVAENGAVLAFPDKGRSEVLAPRVPPAFLDALTQRGIAYDAGASVVDLDAGAAGKVLSIIRELELPLVLAFNRSRLMVLPQAVSKATGLHAALRSLRLSEHNAIAIGDAENDHTLLGACEIGAAVAWGSRALREVADEIIEGDGPLAVAAYLRRRVNAPRLDLSRASRRSLLLGYTTDQAPVSLAVRGRNVLVVGDPRAGKSWIAGLLSEQLILQRYCVCLVDPEGDYRSLAMLPGVVVLGGEDPPPRPREVSHALRNPDLSVVIDLSRLSHANKLDYVGALLPLLAALRRRNGLPHRIVLDEAHYFVRDAALAAALDFPDGGYTLVTYRPSALPLDVLVASQVVIATRLTDPDEVAVIAQVSGRARDGDDLASVLGGLEMAQAVLLPATAEAEGTARRFSVLPRITTHVRHQQKYVDVPVVEKQAFVFSQNGVPTGARARTVREFVEGIATCAEGVLDGHLRRGDFSRWLADVLGDFPLATRVRELEQLYQLRQLLDVRVALVEAIQQRYEIMEAGPATRTLPV